MKKSNVFLLHFCYWLFYSIIGVLVISLLMGMIFMEEKFTQFTAVEVLKVKQLKVFSIVSYFIPALISYLLTYFIVFKYFINKNWKLVLSVLASIFISVVVNSLIVLTIHLIDPVFQPIELATLFELLLFVTCIVGLLNAIMGIIIKGFVKWFSEVNEKKALQEQNHQMELALVKSQLDPHFLFNSINNIDVLIHKDADKASAFLNKLSDIMRFMLFETKNENIALSKELTYIEKYIELQRIRSSNGQYVQFSKQLDNENQLIAPMLFIPFIENAFKYSETFKSEKAVIIQLELLNGKLKFICKNRYSISTAKTIESNGLGNDLIQKRIGLLYPDHKLTISKDEIYFSVLLELDL